jgi:RecA/RadA recombinase
MSSFIDKLTKKLEKFDSTQLTDKDPLKSEQMWVDSGVPILDYHLKTFGFKKGVIIAAGESTAGKSTLGLTIVANFLRKYENAICIFMLSEERLNEDYVKRLGVDVGRVYKVHSEFLEDLFYKTQLHIDHIEEVWKEEKMSGKPKIILLWDSVNATNSRAEWETYKENVKAFDKSVDKDAVFKLKHAKIADFAKVCKQLIKAIHAQLYSKDILMICLNHLTDDIGNPMGGKVSTGGSWQNFFPYCRLQLQVDKLATSKIKIGGEKWAQITDIKVMKNDFGGYTKTQMKICIGYGIVLSDEDIEFAVQEKILKKEKESKYSFLNGKLVWSSPRTFLNLYRSENKLLRVLHKKVSDARHKQILSEKGLEEEE